MLEKQWELDYNLIEEPSRRIKSHVAVVADLQNSDHNYYFTQLKTTDEKQGGKEALEQLVTFI